MKHYWSASAPALPRTAPSVVSTEVNDGSFDAIPHAFNSRSTLGPVDPAGEVSFPMVSGSILHG